MTWRYATPTSSYLYICHCSHYQIIYCQLYSDTYMYTTTPTYGHVIKNHPWPICSRAPHRGTKHCSSSPARSNNSGGGGQHTRDWRCSGCRARASRRSRLQAPSRDASAPRGRRPAGLKVVEVAGDGTAGGRHGAVGPWVLIRWPLRLV
jgi:hypothetical protein